MISQLEGKRIDWVDISKGIAIILVVIGHCIPDAASPMGVSISTYRWLHDIIYSFHMPLFFFLAGYMVSRDKIMKSGYHSIDMIKKRAKRLLVPYFFVGFFYAPFKMLLSRFANKPYDIENIWKIIIGVNPDGELWFLYSLFVITVISALFAFSSTKSGLLISAALLIWNPWNIITSYLFFFLLGIYVKNNYRNFVEELRLRHILLLGILFVAGNYGLIALKQHAFFLLTAMCGMTMVFWISYKASSLKWGGTEILRYCGIMSMDIYILSDIFKIPFRIILWNKMHLYDLSFIVCVVMALMVSLLVSRYIIRRNSLLKYLVLGI